MLTANDQCTNLITEAKNKGNETMNYGLENSANWGWDWFGSFAEAKAARTARPKLYGHNRAAWVQTSAQISANNI